MSSYENRVLDDMDKYIRELTGLWPGRDTERWIRAIGEEAGEIIGAYNKWTDGNKTKPKNVGDVLEEMAQTLGCIFATALQLGTGPLELLDDMNYFLEKKAAQIKKNREEH